MNETILYCIQTILSAGIFLLIYRLFVRNTNAYNWNRFYLLSTMIISLFLPLFNISSWFTAEKTIIIYAPQILLNAPQMEIGPALTFTPTQQVNHLFTLSDIISSCYWVIAVLLFLRFAWGIMRIYELSKTYDYRKSGNLRLYPIQRKTTFSFFNYIFIQPAHWEKPSLEYIIEHEKAHVKNLHSLDNLLTELILVFGWFNPFYYVYRSDLHLLHECQADQSVINSGCDQTTYHQLLMEEVTGNMTYIIVNQFSYSLIKRRFKMISKNKQSRLAGFRILLAIPTAFALMMLFSFTSLEKTTSIIKSNILQPTIKAVQKSIDNLQNSTTIKIDADKLQTLSQKPELPKIDQYLLLKNAESIDKYLPGGFAKWSGFFKNNFKYPQDEINGGSQGIVAVSFILSETGAIESPSIYGNGTMNGTTASDACKKEALRVLSMMPKMDPILKDGKPQRVQFTLPVFLSTLIPHVFLESTTYAEAPLPYSEKMPEFKGGYDDMLNYIGKNMHYPEAAVKEGIQGSVFVKFVVDKTGKLTNIEVERGIGGGCDEEAQRIIKSMPNWNPGLQSGNPVNVIEQVPIKFKLKATYTTTDNAQK
jgi:TonB family protein